MRKTSMSHTTVLYTKPSKEFWNEYQNLWNNSQHRPAFQSPGYLNVLANKFEGALTTFVCRSDERMTGAAFFRKNKWVYRFLSDGMADHNFFILDKDCTPEDIKVFFEKFYQRIKLENWTLILKNHPVWAAYGDAFWNSGESNNLFRAFSRHAVCPALAAETPQALYQKLEEKKELRYYVRRLKSQLDAVFETFTNDEDLESWVEGFCALHVQRWKGTGSPSKYENPEMQHLLFNSLKAWISDNVVVRFSIKTGYERISYVIGLVQQNTLIYHSIAFDAGFSKYSPGKTLLYIIGQWMEEHQLNVLDFGEGAEKYKYDFANEELQLEKVYISNKLNLPFIFRAKLERNLHENTWLRQLYREKIKLAFKKNKR